MLSFFHAIREWWQARRTRQITAGKAYERVRRGAAYLDEVDPGWHRRIDAEALALDDGQYCILGQIHGEFRLGLGRSGLISLSSAPRASMSPVAYGFTCVGGVSEAWQQRDYAFLNDAWTEAVRDRQEADPEMETSLPDPAGDSVPEAEVVVTRSASTE